MSYVNDRTSIGGGFPVAEERVLTTVTNRYIGANPQQPPVYRVLNAQGFLRGGDYRYDMDAAGKLPDLREGQFVYAAAKLWAEEEGPQSFRISCCSHTRLFVNGRLAFESNHRDDVLPDSRTDIRWQLRQGWNHFVLEFEKTGTGCGAKFGTGSVKGAPLHFLAPSVEREGEEGWIFSEPVGERLVPGHTKEVGSDGADARCPGLFLPGQRPFSEQETGMVWLPKRGWTAEEKEAGAFARLFGREPGREAVAWAKLDCRSLPPDGTVRLSGSSEGTIRIYADGELIYAGDRESGGFECRVSLGRGIHDVVVRSACAGERWGFDFASFDPAGGVCWLKPHPVEGMKGSWLYAGPFAKTAAPEAADVPLMDRLLGTGEERTFWQADQPGARVRPYLENRLYGRWNYPLGVTLYGILETGAELGREDYVRYAADHIELCTSLDELVLWDSAKHGAPGINHQLAWIDSLDDCGSFGAAMLQAHRKRSLKGAGRAADRIARYIADEQDRLEDGTLYRFRSFSELMVDTIWCDDLYMSVPFLCRYYELTGDTRYLDDAAEQFLLYKKRLYMKDLRIMHHVYNLKFGKPCSVPWGRGNGWVLFSLAELLAVLPEEHPRHAALTAFFRELCGGYLDLQDEKGLWHQVLTDPSSYAETSCTAMFVYAFSRGVRYGWLPDPEPYARAALRGYDALAANCIDRDGNIYGVCRGSGYSFSPLYYKERLSWLPNDTHGIGIVLLAVLEAKRLRGFLAGQAANTGEGAAVHAE